MYFWRSSSIHHKLGLTETIVGNQYSAVLAFCLVRTRLLKLVCSEDIYRAPQYPPWPRQYENDKYCWYQYLVRETGCSLQMYKTLLSWRTGTAFFYDRFTPRNPHMHSWIRLQPPGDPHQMYTTSTGLIQVCPNYHNFAWSMSSEWQISAEIHLLRSHHLVCNHHLINNDTSDRKHMLSNWDDSICTRSKTLHPGIAE